MSTRRRCDEGQALCAGIYNARMWIDATKRKQKEFVSIMVWGRGKQMNDGVRQSSRKSHEDIDVSNRQVAR